MLSLHRGLGGVLLRVTRLEQDVWLAMIKQMQELQGPTISLARERQEEALSKLHTTTRTVERSVDLDTARLFETLAKALLARAQVVRSDVATFDGVGYYLWSQGIAGTIANPPFRSVLQRVAFVADWLGRLVENPAADEGEDLEFIRREMVDVLARTRRKEPCLSLYRR
jgi:hypothetical protein